MCDNVTRLDITPPPGADHPAGIHHPPTTQPPATLYCLLSRLAFLLSSVVVCWYILCRCPWCNRLLSTDWMAAWCSQSIFWRSWGLYLSHTARVIEAGLVNGALGTVISICYKTGGPPNLPLAAMVQFDNYNDHTLRDNTIPITPIWRTWLNSRSHCSYLQILLQLPWAVTIHKVLH